MDIEERRDVGLIEHTRREPVYLQEDPLSGEAKERQRRYGRKEEIDGENGFGVEIDRFDSKRVLLCFFSA